MSWRTPPCPVCLQICCNVAPCTLDPATRCLAPRFSACPQLSSGESRIRHCSSRTFVHYGVGPAPLSTAFVTTRCASSPHSVHACGNITRDWAWARSARFWSRCSDWTSEEPGFDSRQGDITSIMFIPALGPIQPPSNVYQGDFPGGKAARA